MKTNTTIKKTIDLRYLLVGVFLSMGALLFIPVLKIAASFNLPLWNLIDTMGSSFVLSLRSPELTFVMKAISWWGYYGTVFLWIAVGYLFYKRKKFATLCVVLALSIGGTALGFGMKQVIQRERPVSQALIQEINSSFPSMHVLSTTVLYISLVYFLYLYTHKFFVSTLMMFLAIMLIFLMGFSRMYLGVHYLSDCIAGVFAGLGYLFIILGLSHLRSAINKSLIFSKRH